MTTPAALSKARHQQAVAVLAEAEVELLGVMKSIDPRPMLPIVDGIMPRRFEALLEGIAPHPILSETYSAYRRAQNGERKAKAAAHRLRFETERAEAPSVASAGPNTDEVFADLREKRRAA